LIPSQGAMGAAIATAVSYAVVYAIRAYDTEKYLRFDLCTLRLVTNTLLIVAQTVLMILEPPYWIVWQVAAVALMLAINGREIVKAGLQLLKRFLKK